MKVGDLVKITRPSMGTPSGTLAMLIGFYPAGAEGQDVAASWEVQLLSGLHRMYLTQDLEIIE
jgi:hypothetical protein